MRPILLATDDPNDVFTFWVYHKQCGVHNRVEVLPDGTDVIRYLKGDRVRNLKPALLIASLRMPSMSGLNLLAQSQIDGVRDFPCILLIDRKDHDLPLVAAAFKLGVERFLHRPLLKADFCKLMSDHKIITMDGCKLESSSGPGDNWLNWRPGGPSLIFGRSEVGENTGGAGEER